MTFRHRDDTFCIFFYHFPQLISYIHVASLFYQKLPKTQKMLLVACAILEADTICLFREKRNILKINPVNETFQKGFYFTASSVFQAPLL